VNEISVDVTRRVDVLLTSASYIYSSLFPGTDITIEFYRITVSNNCCVTVSFSAIINVIITCNLLLILYIIHAI